MVATQTPLRLRKLEVSNFLRITALTVDAEGKHVSITGKNGQGKTSALEAIWSALHGASTRETPEPIHRGSDKSSIRLDLGEFIVERHFVANGSKLVVTAADGGKISRPQQLLDGLLATYSLDPVAFIERRPQDQIDDILTICEITPPIKAVSEITGESAPARPGESADSYLLRLSADDSGLYYLRRRESGRIVDDKRAAVNEQRAILEALGDDEQAASTSDLLAELSELDKEDAKRKDAAATVASASQKLVEAKSKLDSIKADRTREDAACQEIEKQIELLHGQLKAKRESIASLDQRISKGSDIVSMLDNNLKVMSDDLAKFMEISERRDSVRNKLATAESVNAKRVKREHVSEQISRLSEEFQSAEAEHCRLDGVLTKLRELRAGLLDGINVGVDGLQVGDGELRLDSVPFLQASQAKKLRVACAVAMRQKPRLRLLRVDDGEHLDSESKSLLLSLADEHDFQVVMTSVSDGDLAVEFIEPVEPEIDASKAPKKRPKKELFEPAMAGPYGAA